MSHTNEIGLVVGKRYMITYKYNQTQQIAILKYSEFADRDTDIYDIEHLLNTKTGELKRNFKYGTGGNFRHFIDIIDMEEIDLEYSKLKLAFARASTSENSLIYDLPNDLIDNIGEKFKELYFEACLKIYDRLTGEADTPPPVPERPLPDTPSPVPERPLPERNRPLPERNRPLPPRTAAPPSGLNGGAKTKKKRKKKKRRKSKKKKKSKTRRRRR